jgi:hypothetical protein
MRLARSARNKYSHELIAYSNMPSANPEIASGLQEENFENVFEGIWEEKKTARHTD